jgi:hypothetical protein
MEQLSFYYNISQDKSHVFRKRMMDAVENVLQGVKMVELRRLELPTS